VRRSRKRQRRRPRLPPRPQRKLSVSKRTATLLGVACNTVQSVDPARNRAARFRRNSFTAAKNKPLKPPILAPSFGPCPP
jgi:hypothetical protein